MVTLTDIAKLAGVSPSTVSNILNDRTNVGEDTKKEYFRLSKKQVMSLITLLRVCEDVQPR